MIGQVKYALGSSVADTELFDYIDKVLDDAMRTQTTSAPSSAWCEATSSRSIPPLPGSRDSKRRGS